MSNRISLVVGNSNYAQSAALRNPENDAVAIAAALRNLGFKVLFGLNLTRDSMEDKLAEFESSIQPNDTALVYYAGHGLQVNGQNYLIPVDAEIRQETHLKRRAFSLDELLSIASNRAKTSLIFLDACRDNPFSRSLLQGIAPRSRSGFLVRAGLAEVRVKRGSFIAFATAPDNVASDGDGQNSPFTEALLAHLETPNVSVSDMMINVRNDVLRATNFKQEPWDQSSLQERFCFVTLPDEPKAPQTNPKKVRRKSKSPRIKNSVGSLTTTAPSGTPESSPLEVPPIGPGPTPLAVANSFTTPAERTVAEEPKLTAGAESIEMNNTYFGEFLLFKSGLVGLNKLAQFLNGLQDEGLITGWQSGGWNDETKAKALIKFNNRAETVAAVAKYNQSLALEAR